MARTCASEPAFNLAHEYVGSESVQRTYQVSAAWCERQRAPRLLETGVGRRCGSRPWPTVHEGRPRF
jgi:hypothetical protein